LAGASQLMLARRLMSGGGKAGVAASATSTACDGDALIGMGKIVNALAGVIIVEHGAHRNLEHNVSTLFAGFVGAFAVASALTFVFGIEAEVHQRIVALAGFHDDIAAVASVSARWPATGHEFFAAKGHAAVAAVAGLYANSCFVYEHSFQFSVLSSQFSVLSSRSRSQP